MTQQNLIPKSLSFPAAPPSMFEKMTYDGLEDAQQPQALFSLEQIGNPTPEVFMPRGKVGIIGGFGGTGKSLAIMHFALSLVTNKETLMRGPDSEALIPNSKSFKVALVYGEEDHLTCKWRLKQALKKLKLWSQYKTILDQLIIIPLADKGDISLVDDNDYEEGESPADKRFDDLYNTLNEYAGDSGLDLVCLDPLSHFGGPDFETDNGQAVRLMRRLGELTKLKGNPTVLGIHHSPKGAKNNRLDDALRGSSALKDNSRWVGIIRRVNEDSEGVNCLETSQGFPVIELIVAKANYSRSGMRVRFALDKGVITAIEGDDEKLLNPANTVLPPKANKPRSNNSSTNQAQRGSNNVSKPPIR